MAKGKSARRKAQRARKVKMVILRKGGDLKGLMRRRQKMRLKKMAKKRYS